MEKNETAAGPLSAQHEAQDAVHPSGAGCPRSTIDKDAAYRRWSYRNINVWNPLYDVVEDNLDAGMGLIEAKRQALFDNGWRIQKYLNPVDAEAKDILCGNFDITRDECRQFLHSLGVEQTEDADNYDRFMQHIEEKLAESAIIFKERD